MARRNQPQLQYDALAVEGALLPPEWLARIAALEAPAQAPADYAIPKGLQLRDEIGRYWRIAEALWAEFAAARGGSDAVGATRRLARELLTQVFGFADLAPAGERTASGRVFPITFEGIGGRVPVVVGPHTEGMDESVPRHGDGSRRRSAWGALQEYLNAANGALWGIATNGLLLRLGRDNASLTRPAWLEADLERIFTEERFADFSVLWLLMHASRFGRADQAPQECPLERWRDAGREEGSRARESLRVGVEEALLVLGQGFLAHSDNGALRQALASGDLTPQAYFNELLRLVYRMIFLLTVEERGILHRSDANADARRLYADGYGMRRLRERSLRHAAHDRHGDLWLSLRPVFAAIGRADGETALALPGLGGLFAPEQCPHLDASALENRALLAAVFRLAWLREGDALARVNWKDMGVEEFGSVYESLLELVPVVSEGGRAFAFAGAGESAGNARKLTGSYYTPDSLVQQLLDTALEPVVKARLDENPEPAAAERALLSLAVVDPACGSGHFLLAAARRLAGHLARLRAGGTPGAEEYRHALRDVVTHCIHGVDRNPMALELARMALWLEAYTPDRALGFLDHHLVCGDALLGLLDLGVLKDGIPDEAFKALTGDDKEVAKALLKLNRAGRKALEQSRKRGQYSFDFGTQSLAEAFAALDGLADDGMQAVESKRARYTALRAETERSAVALAADCFVGAFLLPKHSPEPGKPATEMILQQRFPTTATLAMVLEGTLPAEHPVLQAARAACEGSRVMHWRLAFPQVFERGGFDVVLGNPPWERIKLQEQEFFAARAPQVAGARNKAEREREIEKLAAAPIGTPEHSVYQAFIAAKHAAEAASMFCHDEARYPLTGVGDVNTYALFAESMYRLASTDGRAGVVVPTGIATDDSTKAFFNEIANQHLISLFDFRTGPGLFSEIGHQRYKFCLLTLGRANAAEFAFSMTQVAQLRDIRRRFTLSSEDIRLVNPNTRTCPTFRSEYDAELTKKIYRRVPVLIDETKPEAEGNPWGLSFTAMFHMSNDSGLFLNKPALGALTLYEAKMIHQFDHRWATYERVGSGIESRDVLVEEKNDPEFTVQPRYWVQEDQVRKSAARVPRALVDAYIVRNERLAAQVIAYWFAGYYLNRGNEKTGNELLIQAGAGSGSEASALESWIGVQALEKDYPLTESDVLVMQRCRSSVDLAGALVASRTPAWLLGWRDICRATDERTTIATVIPRAAVGHTMPLISASKHNARELSCLLANLNALVLDYAARQKVGGTHLTYGFLKQFPAFGPSAYTTQDQEFISKRVLELTFTACDLTPWAHDLGFHGPPFRWDPDRRALLRAELDAYYAHLYGLTRDELRYILDPADVMGPDYPSETFRVLKQNEERQFGEYRTRRLVLEAWDRLFGA